MERLENAIKCYYFFLSKITYYLKKNLVRSTGTLLKIKDYDGLDDKQEKNTSFFVICKHQLVFENFLNLSFLSPSPTVNNMKYNKFQE